jgi:SAM-dependent methyltransferase
MLYFLDSCSIFRGIFIADGWSELGVPEILCKGEPIACSALSIARPDVAAVHGGAPEKWGFKVCAFLSPGMASEDLALRFGGTEIIRSPATLQEDQERHQFNTLTQRLLSQSKAGDRVLEIGSRARSGVTHRYLVHPDVEYVGLDITNGPNVDVVGDAHHLSRHVSGQFDTIFSVSVFEHLLMPWKVALEMNQVLKPGGLAYIQSHHSFPLHDEPWDFWRFSKEAWSGLFNAHTGFEIVEKGNALRCRIAPESTAAPHLDPGFDNGRSHLLSACLVRKTGPAKVQWDAESADLYDLAYDHGQT